MEAVDALLAPVEASAGSTSNTSEMAKATIKARIEPMVTPVALKQRNWS